MRRVNDLSIMSVDHCFSGGMALMTDAKLVLLERWRLRSAS